MPSLIAFGASSTSALASFRPRPVAARTTLITGTFWPPTSVRTTSTVADSSSPPPSAAGAPTAAGAAAATAVAETRTSSSSALMRAESSSTEMLFSSSIQSSVEVLVATLLLLVSLKRLKLGREAGDHRAETAHQAGQGAGDDAGELAVEDVARRQAGNRFEALLVERRGVHEAPLVGEDFVLFVEGRDRFRRLGGVAANEGEGDRALQQLGEALLAGLVGGEFGQPVLDDAEARVGLSQLRSQLCRLGDADAAIVDGKDRLRCLDLGGDLLDGCGLFLAVHRLTCTGLSGSRPAGGLRLAATQSRRSPAPLRSRWNRPRPLARPLRRPARGRRPSRRRPGCRAPSRSPGCRRRCSDPSTRRAWRGRSPRRRGRRWRAACS